MNPFREIALWTILLVAALPAASFAQARLERAQAEIERTEPQLEHARSAVAAARNATARAELDRAVELQAGARSALAQDRPRIAIDMTLRARAGSERALSAANGLPDPDRVRAQLDQTREIIDAARGRIEVCDQDRARMLLRTADEMQRRSEAGAEGGHYLAALQLTMGARERVSRALRQCNAADLGAGTAERVLRRTDEAIQRAQGVLGDDAPANARELLSRAIDLQARARQEYRGQHVDSSVRLALSARTFAARAVRMAGRAR